MAEMAFDNVNIPNYANAIVTTGEIVDAISSLHSSDPPTRTVALSHS